jgi:hypothetical protein
MYSVYLEGLHLQAAASQPISEQLMSQDSITQMLISNGG